MVRPFEVRAARPEQRHDDLERLLEAAEDLVLGQPEGVRLPGQHVPPRDPNTNRPPLISSSVSAALAMIPGFRWSADSTHVPTLIREVTAATAPAIDTPSHLPWRPFP